MRQITAVAENPDDGSLWVIGFDAPTFDDFDFFFDDDPLFTTPMLDSFFSVGIWALGHLSRDLRDIGAGSDSESVRQATALFHRVMPDLESFNFSIQAAHGLAFSASDVWLPLIYGGGYVTILLISAIALFERRDLR